MPGFVIHLSVAREYIKKHPQEIKDEELFFKGVIAPDFTNDKSQTHYGIDSCDTNLKLYLESNKIETDYDKGWFLHLVTDYIFYKKYYKNLDDRVYEDYDVLNEILIEKYNVPILKEIEKYAIPNKGTLQLLSEEKIFEFIEEVSNWELNTIKNKIENNEDII